MASSDEFPGAYPARDGGDNTTLPPGDPTTMKTSMIDKGASMIQSLKPIKQISLHLCSFACYGHDPSRQIEVHFYVHRVNEDFLQCAVYDCDSSKIHLIGPGSSILCRRGCLRLPTEEQKLWHSHDYEVQTGLLVTLRLQNIAKTYGKFWCTWQTDCGDKLPLGAPSLMMSPQDVNIGKIKPGLLKKRDDEYGFSTRSLKESRVGIMGPDRKNPMADYWVHHGKGLAIDIMETDMKKSAPFP